MKTVKVADRKFRLSIPQEQIQKSIEEVAQKMNTELQGKDVIFIGILNGSFMFAADLFKRITIPCQITFVKVASYVGTSSSGKVKRLIGINENIEGKTVVVLEDIIDTGITMEYILKQLKGYEPAEIKIATLLFKPDAFLKEYKIDYVGIEIPNDFIVGYGLDYKGFGRNLADIYTVVEDMKEIDLSDVKLIISNNIIRIIYDENVNVDLVLAQRVFDAIIRNINEDEKYAILSDISSIINFSKDAREFFATRNIDNIVANAILIKTSLQKMMADLYRLFSKPNETTEYFNDEEKAIQWLNEKLQEAQ